MSERFGQVEEKAGLREWLNRHAALVTAVVAILVLIAVVAVVVQVIGARRGFAKGLPPAYFSDDDGQTYFVAGMENVPPFQRNGKTAVRAYVFGCGTGKPFVGYLERFNEKSHKAMVENRATPQDQIAGRELKRPGPGEWVKSNDRKAGAIADVRCADGSQPEPIEP